MKEDNVLEVSGICKSFGGIQALQDVRFELKKGEVHALVGANGAGKSTLIKILTGAHSCDSGRIVLNGTEVDVRSPAHAKSLGISAVYQEFSLVNGLTVAENIFLGKLPTEKRVGVKTVQRRSMREKAQEILSQINFCVDPDTLVRDLTVAEKQLVEIAKALSNKSSILIMDEPTASLTDNDIQNLFRVIKDLISKGISIIYISHRLEELPVISDRITVFRDGRYITTFNMKDASKDTIIEHMVGSTMIHTAKRRTYSDEVLMEVKKCSSGRDFSDISFKLHKGEILGITGLAGAGRTELVRAIFGADPLENGEIWVKGKKTEIRTPSDAKRLGIGFVTEDRKEEGLVMCMDIQSNMTLTILDELTNHHILQRDKEAEIGKQFMEHLSIKASGLKQRVKNLSGGNQQKVIIAKWLATKPSILILDEPTRGIDVGSKGQIYTILNKLTEEGIGVIIISSEIEEILAISDNILVMAEGKITATLGRDEATQDRILHYATTKTQEKAV